MKHKVGKLLKYKNHFLQVIESLGCKSCFFIIKIILIKIKKIQNNAIEQIIMNVQYIAKIMLYILEN